MLVIMRKIKWNHTVKKVTEDRVKRSMRKEGLCNLIPHFSELLLTANLLLNSAQD